MHMKKLLFIIIVLVQVSVTANMANPVMKGTLGSRPFVNQFVDVEHEDLSIKIDKDFKYAAFNVKYHIYSSKDGTQIPFLFYASEYLDSFSVKIDGIEVDVKDIPFDYRMTENTEFNDFAYFFEESNKVTLDKSSTTGIVINLHDMIYFETDIKKGKHIIEVNYRATQWIDTWGWVNEYSFRYALSPAKYWKSFGTLTVNLDASDFNFQLNSNILEPKVGNINDHAEWFFNQIPTDVLQIKYVPKISKTAEMLIQISPRGLAILTGLFLMVVHIFLMIRYRKKKPSIRFSSVVILGSIVVPFVVLISWMYYYDVIDAVIGLHAGKTHGYTFFVIGLYPIVLPLYWLVCWFIDKRFKSSLIPHI